jgi:hypothetical protein
MPTARNELIGGETDPATPVEAVPALPDVVTAGTTRLTLIRYDDWKARVRLKQTSKGDSTDG